MATTKKKQTSYEKVKDILNKAAEESQANYQGYGNFWETLSLKAFEKVKIYGIQMIAPVPESSCNEILGNKPAGCCSSHESGVDEAETIGDNLLLMLRPAKPKHKGRGAASGLIKGLKGEFPYDADSFNGEENSDGHFPRLPWGGKEVSEKDIKFISDWIDQGCLENDTNYLEPEIERKVKYKVNMELTDIYKSKLKQRKNIENLSDDELYRLRCAFYELKKLNAWPRDRRSLYSWGKLHGNVCEHGWEQFLTWHRMFLYEFEQTLQDFDPTVTLPYWNWTDKEFNNGVIPKVKPEDYPKEPISGVIPEAFRCWINEKAINNLIVIWGKVEKGKKWEGIIRKLVSIIDTKFNSGVEFFYMAEIEGPEYYKYSPEIIKQLEQINPLWYPLRYPGMFYELENGKYILKDDQPIAVGEEGMQQNFHHHYPRAEDVENILNVDNWRDFAGGPEYNQSFGVLDMAPHNTIHIWLGGFNKNYKEDKPIPGEPMMGDMLNNLTAGFDPIFWPHHVMIDRMFHKWQESHPGQGPFNPNGALAGLGYSVNDALSTERLGYEYVSVGHVFQLANPRGVSVFKSDYINFDASVYQLAEIKGKGKVELRLHEVVQPENSFIVRIFLNSPDADMFTPATDKNKYYAGSVFFWGHGRCVGGPGHCAPPPSLKRDNDLRPPDHNSKRNYRVNITKTVEALAKNDGVTEFQINLIVVGPDGSDHPGEFFPEAISMDVTI